jgi:hypothetical protein
VHVPFAARGAATGWDIGGVMDLVAVTIFAAASAAWVWRRKRSTSPPRRSEEETL